MKGIVLVELLEMIEARFSYDMVDSIIEQMDPSSGGAYTTVGTYPHSEVIAIVQALSEKTGVEIPYLVKAFGNHLLGRFVELYPDFFADVNDTFSFLQTVENHIHIEVLKLYSDAELPKIACEFRGDNVLILEYQSTRPFADLAEGLILSTIEHYGESIRVNREDLDGEPGTRARFTMEKV